jgi:hypothetical protein
MTIIEMQPHQAARLVGREEVPQGADPVYVACDETGCPVACERTVGLAYAIGGE